MIDLEKQNKIREFDNFFSTEYNYLKSFCKSIDPQHPYRDLLHECYLKLRDRISEVGYTGDTFLNYTRVTLMNTYKSQYRQEKKIQKIDIENPDFLGFVEEKLLLRECQDIQQKELQDRNTYLTTMIYDYIDRFYTERDQFIFKTYYLLSTKHVNYEQLSEITGYSLASVSNVIKKMKKDLRMNLRSYILNDKPPQSVI